MKIYIVGDSGPEHNSVRSVHKTRKGAFEAWNKLRIQLLEKAKASLKSAEGEFGKEMFAGIVRKLSCKDPKKIDNCPQETPRIREIELQE